MHQWGELQAPMQLQRLCISTASAPRFVPAMSSGAPHGPHLTLSLLLPPAGRRRPRRGAAFRGQPLISSRLLSLSSLCIYPTLFYTIPRAPHTRLAYNMATLQKPGEKTPLRSRKRSSANTPQPATRPATRRPSPPPRPASGGPSSSSVPRSLCPALQRPLFG